MSETNPLSTQALSPEDFDLQDAELDAMREQDPDTPDWEYCEGFLAALVCTRRPVPPEEYWPALFGEGFNPMEHMEFVWRWKRRWTEVETALDAPVENLDDERTYHPEALDIRGAVLATPEAERTPEEEGPLPSYGQSWAAGFLDAVQVFADDWEPPRDAESADMLEISLQDIAALVEDDRHPPAVSMYAEDGPPSVSNERLDAWAAAIWAVYDLRQLWKSLGPRIDPVRKGEQPGRNDPCPCGSGKKFKKCCGA
jgi:uncharacterized protein